MRKEPLPVAELAMARRLAEFRKRSGLAREDLARRAGIHPDLVARVELGRMPLRYGEAEKLLPALGDSILNLSPVNPLWLAFGKKPRQLSWPLLLPPHGQIGLNPKTRFSEFARENRELLESLSKDPPEAELPESWLAAYALKSAELHARLARAEAAVAIFDGVRSLSGERGIRASRKRGTGNQKNS